MLRLWSHGTLEGQAKATSGTLTVPVPVVPGCAFQADVSVIPPGGQRFYFSGARAVLPGCGPPQTIAGDIFLCSAAGAPTTTEVPGGTLAATGPQTLPSQANPLMPTKVPAGGYSMTAGAPSGYVLVTCGGTATVDSGGATASEPVTVPGGGAGAGVFYAALAPSTSPGGPGGSPGSGGPGSTGSGNPTPAGGLGSGLKPATAATTHVNGNRLAFTGMNTAPLLVAGLGALALGGFATALSRIRRRPSKPTA
jgi:hypothetical protein